MNVSKIVWGNGRAEKDRLLHDAFVSVADYNSRLLNAEATFIVGGRGSGKTALISYFAETLKQSGVDFVVQISPPTSLYSVIDEIYPDSQNIANMTDLWKVVFSHLIVVEYGESLTGRLTTSYEERIRQYFVSVSPGSRDILETFVSVLKMYGSNKFIKQALPDKGTEPSLPSVTELNELAKYVCENKNVWLFIDDLDWCWDGSQIANSILVSLLRAKSEFERNKANIIVTLRTEIYSLLCRMPEFGSKFTDRIELTWNEERLQKLLVNRIKLSYKEQGELVPKDDRAVFDTVFGDTSKESTQTFLGRLSNGNPRALLDLVAMYTQTLAEQERSTRDPNLLRKLELPFARKHLAAVLADHEKFLPQLRPFTSGISSCVLPAKFTVKELKDAFNDAGLLRGDTNFMEILRALCLTGVFAHSRNGKNWEWEPTNLDKDSLLKIAGQFRAAFTAKKAKN